MTQTVSFSRKALTTLVTDAAAEEGRRVAADGLPLPYSTEFALVELFRADPLLGGSYIAEIVTTAREVDSRLNLAQILASAEFPEISATARPEFETELREAAERYNGASL